MKHQRINIRRHSRALASLAVVAFIVGSADAADTADAAKALPEHTFDGLQRVPNSKITALYLRQGVDFGSYDKVAIRDCHVAFRKDWQREQNEAARVKVTDEDMALIKTDLAEGFRRVFTDRLTANGETVTTAAGTGVLILRPAIIDLDVSVPDRADPRPRGIYSSASAGQATLYLELYDSVTDQLLARAIDVVLKTWAGTFLQNARSSAAGAAR
jgi:hypothetical protein